MSPPLPGKARRISTTFKHKILGLSSKTILESFKTNFNNSHKYARLYIIPDKVNQRVVVKANTHSGSQILFEVKTHQQNIMFEPMGVFDEGFSHRLIRDTSLRGKGLGSKALESERALKRATRKPQAPIVTSEKSTILLLLKKGYKINKSHSIKAMNHLGIKNEKELENALKKMSDSDPALGHFKFEKK